MYFIEYFCLNLIHTNPLGVKGKYYRSKLQHGIDEMVHQNFSYTLSMITMKFIYIYTFYIYFTYLWNCKVLFSLCNSVSAVTSDALLLVLFDFSDNLNQNAYFAVLIATFK